MSGQAPNAGIVGRIIRAIETHDRIIPSMKGNHLESIENMLHGTLGEKDAEIARLKDEIAEKVAETYAIAELMQFGQVTAYVVMQHNQNTNKNEEVELTFRRDRAKYLVEQSILKRWIMQRQLSKEGFQPAEAVISR